jgi:cellulose synthase/poly-beta-1,6-N-acetylglucosamine synthase-like glycosyltransferase
MEAGFFTLVRNLIMFFVIVTLAKNYFFLAISPFYPLREKWRHIKHELERRRASLPNYKPKVSVIIPAWNEGVGVIKTLDSVLNNGYDNLQVVLVNDGSTDNSDALVKNYMRELKKKKHSSPSNLKYIYKENGGKGRALNTGIEAATGEIILTVDADSVLRKDSIKHLVKYYKDKEIMAVVGNVEVVNTSTLVGLAQHLEYFFGFYNKRAHALLGAEYIFGGACASFRKEVFEKIGLFDTENKTEDIEMSMRTKFHGMKSTYAEDVICYTEGASDVKSLIAQRIRWKKGRLDTFKKYRSMFFSTEEHHNAFLSFFVLPFSLLTEITLVFEPIAVAIMVAFVMISSEYLSLALGICYIFLAFVAVPTFHSRPRSHYLFYFPFWPLFYFLDWIEFISLYKSIKMIRKGKQVEWQRWDRKGIHSYVKESS